MTYDASDRKQIRRQAKVARALANERKIVVMNLMSSPAGRHYVWDMFSDFGVFSTTYATDPCDHAFNEGNRNAMLRLQADILAACPDQYITMMREANDRSIAADRGSERRPADSGRDDSPGQQDPEQPSAGAESEYTPGIDDEDDA